MSSELIFVEVDRIENLAGAQVTDKIESLSF